ncbi:MAG: lipid-binding SYLF domain-containing protein [Humidesulfovibrio sp.]|nr:lipid-binding SYLF domain-containing protein [Humidesulfovibrio sp.]
MSRRHALVGLILLSACWLSACASARTVPADQSGQSGQPSPRNTMARDLILESARTVKELRAATAYQILDYALEDAYAVIVLPGVYQAGFFYSIRGGNGVILARTSNGSWGAPAFMGIGGAGYGLQAGLEKQRLVLVVQEREMLESILANGLSFDVIAKYDVLGVREEVGRGSLTTRSPVLAFGDGVGFMAGVAMRGAVLTLNEGLTQTYYGQDQGNAKTVMQSVDARGIQVFELWGALSANLPGQAGDAASR